MEAVYTLGNHPTAENIISEIRQSQPHIATGTVYKVLETLCDQIEDYNDAELDKILREHFKTKELDGFKIEEFVLQIQGKFDNCI